VSVDPRRGGDGLPGGPPSSFRGDFRRDVDARHVYSESAGIVRIVPAAVAVPADAADLEQLVHWARKAGMPLTPRGSGSSMAGGAVGSGVVVDLSRFDWIADVDAPGRRIWCGAGALCDKIDRAAREHGLRFPVDPSSAPFCTIGGMVGTNAAGAHAPAFGQTRDWVRSLDCVLADGSRVVLTRGSAPPGNPLLSRFLEEVAPALIQAEEREPAIHPGVMKEASGYGTNRFAASGDVVDLIVGSEGTLAIVVAVEVALAPAALRTASVLGHFASLEQAVAAAADSRRLGAAACELLDRTYLEIAGVVAGGDGVEALLLAEVEGAGDDDTGAAATAVAAAFRSAGANRVRLTLDPDEEHSFWETRHAVSPVLALLDPAVKSMQIIEDAAVPPGQLPDFVRGVRLLAASCDTPVVIFGHAADANIHVNPLIDVRRDGWQSVVERFLHGVAHLALVGGGTLSGEHGDGRIRAPLLDRCWSPAVVKRFRSLKEAFDPDYLLNPGVKLEAPRGVSWTVKYDPGSAPLSAPAASALGRVERERSYASFRLGMLT
jgi:FAD/FMN-containing dehydrogenase